MGLWNWFGFGLGPLNPHWCKYVQFSGPAIAPAPQSDQGSGVFETTKLLRLSWGSTDGIEIYQDLVPWGTQKREISTLQGKESKGVVVCATCFHCRTKATPASIPKMTDSAAPCRLPLFVRPREINTCRSRGAHRICEDRRPKSSPSEAWYRSQW